MARMLMSNSQVQAISRNRTEQKNLSEKLEQLNHVAYKSKDAIQQDLKTWRRFRHENVKNSGWSPKSLRPEPGEDVFSSSSGRSNTPNSPTQAKDTFTKPWAYTYSHGSHNKVYKELAQVSQNSKKALDLNLKSNSIDSPPVAGGTPDSGDPIEQQPTMLKHVRTMQGITRAISVLSVKDKLLELRQKEETACMKRPGLENEKGDADRMTLLSEVGKLQKINKFSAICKLTKTVSHVVEEKRPVKDKLAKSVCAIKGLTKSRNLFTCSKCGGNTEVSKKGERFSNAAIAYKGLHRAQTILKLPSPQPEPECQTQPDENITVRRCSCNCSKKQREPVSKLWNESKAKVNKTTAVVHDDKPQSVADIHGPEIVSRRRRSPKMSNNITTEQIHRMQIAKEKISKCFGLQANDIDAKTTDMVNAEQIQRSDSEGKDESNSISKASQVGKTIVLDGKPKSDDASCPINLDFPSTDRQPIENNNTKCDELQDPDITKSGENLATRPKDTKRKGPIDTFTQAVDCFTITHSDSPLTRASRMAIDRLKMKRRSITYDELPGIKSGTSQKDKEARHRLKSDDSSLGTLSKRLTKPELKKLTKPASMNDMNSRFNIDNNTNHSLVLGKSVSATINEDSDGMPLTKSCMEEEKDGDVDHQVVMKILQEEVFNKLNKFQKRKNSTLALRKFSSVSKASTVFRNFSNRKKKSTKTSGVNVFTRIAKFMLLQVWKKRRERMVEEPIRAKESSGRNRQHNLNAKHDSFISSGRNCQVDSYERERNLFTTVDEAYSNHGTYKQRSTPVERKQGDGGYNSKAISDSACEIRASDDPATYSNTNDVTRNCSLPHRDQPNDNSNSNRTCYNTGGPKNYNSNNNNNNTNTNTNSSNGQTTGHVRFWNDTDRSSGDSCKYNDDNNSNNNNKRNHNKNNKNDLRNHDDDNNNNNNTSNNNNNNNNDNNNNSSSDVNNTIPTERRKSSAAELLINAGLAFINTSNAARNENGRSGNEQSKLRLKPAVYHRGVRLFNYVSPEKRYLTSSREKAKKDPSIRWHSAVGAMVNKHEVSQEPTLAERTFPKHARHRALHQMIEANHTPAPDDSLKAHNEILRTRIQTFLDSVEPFKKKKA